MDENVFIKKSTLTSIGDAIRSKEGSEEKIPTSEMAARILALGGGVEYTTGTATFGLNYNSQTISHGLGKKPKLFRLYWAEYDTATTIYLNYVLFTEWIATVWYGQGSDGVGVNNASVYSTIPVIDVPQYGAVTADETNVYITATARQWTKGEWIWEAYTW